MKVIVGLGNPGSEYSRTPHNIGFWAVERIANQVNADWKDTSKFKGQIARANVDGEALWLVKPQTYMNLSGECVVPFLHYYGASAKDLLVISDDCDLPTGTMRLRASGSAGGHKGLISIITLLGTQTFARLRLGVGRSKEQSRGLKSFVVGRYSPEHEAIAEETAQQAAQTALCWLKYGTNEAMNRFNSWKAQALSNEAN